MHPSQLTLQLKAIERQGLYRERRVLEGPSGVEVIVDGKRLLNFSSNDYLGLANHPAVVAAFKRGAETYGVGSGASHLVCGHSKSHHRLEEELAEFVGRERALLFSTGYMANLGVISALAGRGDWIFEDRLNHASLLDGGLLSGARFKRYAHLDVESLKRALERCPARRKLIVSDGVFSMDGDLTPVPGLAKAAEQSNAWLLVDDAHGLGVIGKNGGGTLEHYGMNQEEVPVLIGTLGKAFGTFGAFVAGSDALIELLIQRARPYIYTTALPPSIAEATRASLRLAQEQTWRREKLQALVQYFRRGAHELGLTLPDSRTPIQPVLVGDNQRALEAGARLFQRGFLLGAIRPPTVPAGSARLRITFSALHEEQQVASLLAELAKLGLAPTAV